MTTLNVFAFSPSFWRKVSFFMTAFMLSAVSQNGLSAPLGTKISPEKKQEEGPAIQAERFVAVDLLSSEEYLGLLMRKGVSYNERGLLTGAYEFISPKGFSAAILVNGQIGFAREVVYIRPDCEGDPYLLESPTNTIIPALPGLVFSAGRERGQFAIGKDAIARTEVIRSTWRVTDSSFRCEEIQIEDLVYKARPNDASETAIKNHYKRPWVRIKFLDRIARSHKQRILGDGPSDQSGSDAPDDTECAPGCFTRTLGNGVCELECATSACAGDLGDCSSDILEKARGIEAKQCTPGCKATDRGDGFCDASCNTTSCGYDDGDCAVSRQPD